MPLKQISFSFEENNQSTNKQVKSELSEHKYIQQKINNKKTTRGRMSLKNMDGGADLIDVPDDEILFQKTELPVKRRDDDCHTALARTAPLVQYTMVKMYGV